MATYTKVDEQTLKVSEVVETNITLDKLKESEAELTKHLGALEQQYTIQKNDFLTQLANIQKAIAEATKLNIVTAEEVKVEETVIE